MNTFTEIKFELPAKKEDWIFDILSMRLSDAGYEGFVEEGKCFSAFIQSDNYNRAVLSEIIDDLNSQFSISVSYMENSIPKKNWNQEWEKNFPSIVIADQCYVRAPFHPTNPDIKFELIIEPKMSFGTAHHETTQLMIEFMLEMDFGNRQVLDMGTGTGILAIMAEKLGAGQVIAIDNDEWSYHNALENVSRNNASLVTVVQGDAGSLKDYGNYDVILANITRNILLNDIPIYKNHLKSGGFLLLSGFYNDDIILFQSHSAEWNLSFMRKKEKNNWVSLLFSKA